MNIFIYILYIEEQEIRSQQKQYNIHNKPIQFNVQTHLLLILKAKTNPLWNRLKRAKCNGELIIKMQLFFKLGYNVKMHFFKRVII